MRITAFVALVRKDLQLFISDRRSVIVSFAVPIVIGAFIGSLTNEMGSNNNKPLRVKVAFADLDASAVSKALVADAQADTNLDVSVADADAARAQVQKGTVVAAVIVPKGFGDNASRAFFQGSTVQKPELTVLVDPSRAIEAGMVRGILAQHVMQTVAQSAFSGQSLAKLADSGLAEIDKSNMPPDQKRLLREMLNGVQRFYSQNPSASRGRGAGGLFSLPYTVREEEVTAGRRIPYNGYAHAFSGMGIQFLLFAMLNAGIELLLERQRGLWKRLRSAPISRYGLLAAKWASGTIISLMTLLVSFGAAMLMFKVRIEGSVVGFLAVAIACSMMAATFGMLVAAIGRTPATARGVSSLAVLVMVMVGGAWFPTFLFPKWIQQLTVIVPVRWAVDGLDATTWRGLPFSSAVVPTLVLCGFALLFGLITLTRFRWEEA
jgi:ABC-2 type transport system permease protein